MWLPCLILLGVAIQFIYLAIYRIYDRPWVCQYHRTVWGAIWPFHSALTKHGSQHFFDEFSISHFGAGVGLGVIALLIIPCAYKEYIPMWTLVIMYCGSVIWEFWENNPDVLDHAWDDFNPRVKASVGGETIVNSDTDIWLAFFGALITTVYLGWIFGLLLFVGLEFLTLATIRECLTLDVFLFLCPMHSSVRLAIRKWQGS